MGERQGALEEVGLSMAGVNPAFWRGRRVLLTGHTGFKGSWLSLWLQSMGAELHGLALEPPTTPALFAAADVGTGMVSRLGDVRDHGLVAGVMRECKPDIVIHMAAQSLVRYSYQAPVETYATNVMGTVNVLEAARHAGTVRVIVNVTTDKCYENREWVWGYREQDRLGGNDPYSNSKACAELVTQAYRRSFFRESGIALASARAGNVIGGGDWAVDRLVPDILRAFEDNRPVTIRNPGATRPWQHVLEPLAGYLMLAERLYTDGQAFADGWNFGPHDEESRPVAWIVERMAQAWGNGAHWIVDGDGQPHEAGYLRLDSSRARSRLAWQPRWNLSTALGKILDWHRSWLAGDDVKARCLQQLEHYQNAG